jgi:hypothetical protein
MRVQVDPAGLRQTKWQDYAIRFFFGGLVTAAAGIIAKEFGPAMGGLFLAFPAIFPASATLIEKHERKKKEMHGLTGTVRGRQAASVDAAGASMGSLGLMVFALVVWKCLRNSPSWIVLPAATLAWLIVSVVIWKIRKAM